MFFSEPQGLCSCGPFFGMPDFIMVHAFQKEIGNLIDSLWADCISKLTLSEESSGTKKLFGLLSFFARSHVVGTTLVVDELVAKIHTVLLYCAMMLYNYMAIKKCRAPLIFTLHDLSITNNDVFRCDEIWIEAKGKKQNSKLYSFVEFKKKVNPFAWMQNMISNT